MRGRHLFCLAIRKRRHLYHEDNSFINHKINRAVEVGLHPVLCIGESMVEFEHKETHQVIERQLAEGLKEIPADKLEHLMVAYEPVWAIGNGHSATPEIAQEVHLYCRQLLAGLYNEDFAKRTMILYGGSVNSTNARELMAQQDIDGLLIGGASLSLETFLQIVNDSYTKIQGEG